MAMINDGDDILDDGSATILVTFRAIASRSVAIGEVEAEDHTTQSGRPCSSTSRTA